MIPEHWAPHHRDTDGELLGYLVPDPTTGGRLLQPVTVFGHPLAAPADPDAATGVLDDVGLSYLADRWLLTLPDRPDPITVTIAEASPDELRVQNADYGYDGDIGHLFTLPVPTGPRLTRA